MDCEIQHSFVGDVLVLILLGQVSDANVRPLSARFAQTIAQIQPQRILVDLRQLAGRPSMAETFFLHNRPATQSSPLQARVALLDLDERRQYAAFHETTAYNAGHRLAYFFDYDQAMAWLMDSAPAKHRDQPPTKSVP